MSPAPPSEYHTRSVPWSHPNSPLSATKRSRPTGSRTSRRPPAGIERATHLAGRSRARRRSKSRMPTRDSLRSPLPSPSFSKVPSKEAQSRAWKAWGQAWGYWWTSRAQPARRRRAPHARTKASRPLPELVREIVRIHAPYTHVPYHQRLDDGVVRFVNNDHCFLSSRASTDLMKLLRPELAYLPLAQTIWYVPTGLDPWNQLLGKMPGHYVRLYELKFEGKPPLPHVHWSDQQPLAIEGTFPEKLNAWLTLVQRGEVINAYRVFLGLWHEVVGDEARRTQLLAHLVFAGLIDVQDRVLHNRSYTTGHKSYRARATVQLARMVGWEHAGSVLYAGVPDMAVGPRWHSTYEMACLVVQNILGGKDQDFLGNDGALSPVESLALLEALLSGEEPGYIDLIVALLRSGKGLRQIIDTIQLGSAQLILETGDPNSYSMPQHSYEYCNNVRWFFDSFEHPHRLKLLFVAAAFVNRSAHHQMHTPDNGPIKIESPRGAETMSSHELLQRLD